MVSTVDFNAAFHYWWEFGRWTSVFKLEWIYITDVHLDTLSYVIHNGMNIARVVDGTELPQDVGVHILNRFRFTSFVSDIFDAFEFMDKREIKLRKLYDFNQLIAKRILNEDKDKPGMDGHYHSVSLRTKTVDKVDKGDQEDIKSFYYENELDR